MFKSIRSWFYNDKSLTQEETFRKYMKLYMNTNNTKYINQLIEKYPTFDMSELMQYKNTSVIHLFKLKTMIECSIFTGLLSLDV